MSPSRDEKITALEQQLADLQATKDRHNAHMRRTMKYYDEAPDGSRQKQEAVETMNSISDKLRAVEREMSPLVDELIALGY